HYHRRTVLTLDFDGHDLAEEGAKALGVGGLMLLETANRIGFIRAHEGAVSCDVGRKNCRQPAGNLGLFWPFRHLRHLADTRSHIGTDPPAGRRGKLQLFAAPRYTHPGRIRTTSLT